MVSTGWLKFVDTKRWMFFIVSFAIMVACGVSHAVPARPGLRELSQPDGTRFQARQRGDEWFHWTETAAGHAIIKDKDTEVWYYAVQGSAGSLKSSGARVAKDKAPSSPQKVHSPRSAGARHTQAATRVVSPTGTANIPVILVYFSDASPTYTPADFNSMLFGESGNTMKRHYTEMSRGTFTVSPGPVGGVLGWYQAPNTHDYYNDDAGHADDLVVEAVKAADAAGVNFAPYDQNGDGKVDVVAIVHQGTGEEASGVSTDIWSHRWDLNSAGAGAYNTNDGVAVNDYIIQPEKLFGGMTTFGVFSHEYGHALGLPDLYDIDYSSEGLGEWSLMAAGSWSGPGGDGSVPVHMDAWCKVQLGWVTPSKPTTNILGASILNAENNAFAYKLWTNGSASNEYYLVENRQQTGFDAYLPGSGVLVYHVDDNVSTDNQNEWYPGFTSYGHYKVAVEQADGLFELEKYYDYADASDPFPGGTTKRTFDNTTTPSTNSYTNTATKVALKNISDSASTMTADVYVTDVGNVQGINVSPSLLTFNTTYGAAPMPSDSFTITNNDTLSLNYTITDDASWLTCSPTSGALSINASRTIGVQVDTTGLAIGTHTAIISIAAPGAANTPQTVSVTLNIAVATNAVTLIAPADNATVWGNVALRATIPANTNTQQMDFERRVGQDVSRTPSLNLSDLATVSDSTAVTADGKVSEAVVAVNITHPNIGDLKVSLVAPDGTRAVLHNRTNGTADNLIKTFDASADLLGTATLGTWELEVQDQTSGNTGVLNSWSLSLGTSPWTTIGIDTNGVDANGEWTATWDSLGTAYGTYQVRALATTAYGDAWDINSNITLKVVPPTLSLSPASLSFTATQGSSPAVQSFSIANSTGGTLSYTISDDAAWLTCNPTVGTAMTETDAIAVLVNTSGLAPGTYTATITIAADGAENAPQTVAVTLTVVAPPPTYNLPFVDDFSTNKGWSGFDTNQWQRGAAVAGAGDNVNAGTYSNDPGSDHTGTSDNYLLGYNLGGVYANSLAEKPVTSPIINCTGSSGVILKYWRWLGVQANSNDQAAVRVTSSLGTQTFWANPASNVKDSAWQQEEIDISSVAANQSNVRIQFVMGSTDSNTVYGGWSIDDVTVQAGSLSTAPQISLSAQSLSFAAEELGSDPPTQSFNLSNAGGGTLTYTISDNVPWLSCSPASGTATSEIDTIEVTVNSSALPVGTNTAVITVTAPGATNTPQAIPVSLVVSSRAAGTLPFADDFSTDKGWTGYAADQWERGAASAGAGDPVSDNSGSSDNFLLGYNIGGYYSDSMPERTVTSPVLDCRGSDVVKLSLWRWLCMEDGGYDHAYIRVSKDAGQTWTPVFSHTGNAIKSAAWTKVEYDISSVAANQAQVQVQFVMGVTDDNVVYGGWSIDDVELLGSATPPVRADALIKANTEATSAYGLDNIYQSIPSGEQIEQITLTRTGAIATYNFKVQNDTTATRTFVLKTAESDGAGWTIAYKTSAGVEITSSIRGATGYTTPSLAPGAEATFTLTISPGTTVARGASKSAAIKAYSTASDTIVRDSVKAVASLAQFQPDNSIRALADTTFAGDGIYNTTGANQTKSQIAARGVTATFYTRVQNDGEASDSMRINGGVQSSNWTVKYYTSSGTEITSSVTSSTGWTTPTLAVGASIDIKTVMTPSTVLTDGSTKDILITATSVTDTTKKDTVKALVTVGSAAATVVMPDRVVAEPLPTSDTSSVSLVKAVADRSQQIIHITFSGQLDEASAFDPAHYEVHVNGEVVAVSSVIYRPATKTVEINLLPNTLNRQSKITVIYYDLRDSNGKSISAGSQDLK